MGKLPVTYVCATVLKSSPDGTTARITDDRALSFTTANFNL
jgi:hypothetical protein